MPRSAKDIQLTELKDTILKLNELISMQTKSMDSLNKIIEELRQELSNNTTIVSFIVLGNYSLGLQVSGSMDFVTQYAESGDLYSMIIAIIETLPCATFVLLLVLFTMIAFYATSFDSIAYTASCYSYHRLEEGQHPHKIIQLLWCALLIVFPIALVFSESSMNNLQSVSIVAAFPIGIVIIIIVWSFLKDAGEYMKKADLKSKFFVRIDIKLRKIFYVDLEEYYTNFVVIN